MLRSFAQSIFLVIFYALIAAGDSVGDDDNTQVCDVAEGVETKTFLFEPFDKAEPETIIWENMDPASPIVVAVAEKGILTYRIDKDLFPELSSAKKIIPILPPTFIRESPAFKKLTSHLPPKPEGVNKVAGKDGAKNIGSFRKAFIISRHGEKPTPIASQPFIRAIAREIQERMELTQVEWKMSRAKQDLFLQRTTTSSGGTFSISRIAHSRDNRPIPAKRGLLISGTFEGSKGIIDEGSTNIDDYKLTEPDPFRRADESSALTDTQRVYLDKSVKKFIPDGSALNKPYAVTIPLEGDDRALWNDDATKTIGLVIMVMTSQSAWILMLPIDLVNEKYLLSMTPGSLRGDPWFQKRIKKHVSTTGKRLSKLPTHP